MNQCLAGHTVYLGCEVRSELRSDLNRRYNQMLIQCSLQKTDRDQNQNIKETQQGTGSRRQTKVILTYGIMRCAETII